ncbi:hypothetical protein [Chitinimonas koreensis]|uniref:hypothetical protein n=1 Tax=Chitinimonas koreensis TaxID=356302 RepID=UPI001654C05D|nr:hypothetical protein [Chitinimonas koreensis]QNM97583.1 hypothetical protein H9L41_04575 [Chitinimonas koreensis]
MRAGIPRKRFVLHRRNPDNAGISIKLSIKTWTWKMISNTELLKSSAGRGWSALPASPGAAYHVAVMSR